MQVHKQDLDSYGNLPSMRKVARMNNNFAQRVKHAKIWQDIRFFFQSKILLWQQTTGSKL